MVEPDRPLMLFGPYMPFIHAGMHSRKPPGKPFDGPAAPKGCWQLFALLHGAGTIDGLDQATRLHPPTALVLPPRSPVRFRVGAGAHWEHLRFDVAYRERRRFGKGNAFEHVEPNRQPDAVAAWGRELSVVVPADLAPLACATARTCNSLWFHDDLAHARANAMLGDLLLELAAAAGSEGGGGDRDDPLARAEEAARRNLALGVTVADMAAAAGISPAQFARRYRAARGRTPGAFLAGLRVEQAIGALHRGATAADTAIACGFRSPTAFTAFCHRYLGCGPREWRRLHT